MYVTPASYRARVESPGRKVSAFMSIGIDVDNTAADDIASITGSFLPMSNGAQLYDANYYVEPKLATFEADGIPTAASEGMIAPPVSAKPYPPECAAWSSSISGADGSITASLSFSFSKEHTSAITVYTVGGPSIVEGSVDFYRGSSVVSVALQTYGGYAAAHGSHTYDSVTINISKISKPYMHMRFSEVEFGDSMTVNDRALAGGITCIQEVDPLCASMPMSEVDFSLMNVEGEFDADNPSGRLSSLPIGSPIYLTMTVSDDAESTTVPIGRYFIAERRTDGERISFTCYDARWNLSRSYRAWSLPSSGTLSSALATQFTALEMPYSIDPSVDAIASRACSFTAKTSMLEDLLAVCQAFGVYLGVDRYGDVTVSASLPYDDYGRIPVASQYTWPESTDQPVYNYLEIQYGTSTYTRDLRSDLTDARNTLSIGNAVITTLAQAQALANRIQAQIYGDVVEVEWLGDPAMDLCDSAKVSSRWTLEDPPSYRAVKSELTYDGSLRQRTTFVK